MNPDRKKTNHLLAVRLRTLRLAHNISQSELASILNICQSTYGAYEIERITMKADMLPVLADYFGTTTDYLLGRSDIK